MPGIPVAVRSLPGLGATALTTIRRGERVPYLGTASQHLRMARGRTLAVVGVVAFVLSVWWRVTVVTNHPMDLWLTIDLSVYYDAGASLAHSRSGLYSHGFGLANLPYLYPPVTALAFHHLTWISFDQIKVLIAAVSMACLVAVGWAAWGMLGYRVSFGRVGASFAVAAVGIWLEPVHSTLILGQVEMLIMALVVVDLAQPDRWWTKGIGIGLATAIKLTPGLFVVYLLLTRRVRAAFVAAGTFAVVTGGAWLVLPTASRQFWFHSLGVTPFDRGYAANQSFQGMFVRLLHDSNDSAKLPWLLASALLAVVGLAAATLAANRGAELLGACLVGVVGLEISPISWTCHWVWFVPLVVLGVHTAFQSRHRWAPRLWVLGGTIAALAWPMRVNNSGGSDPRLSLIPTGLLYYAPHGQNLEETWDPFQMVLGNSYVLFGVGFVVAAAVLELRRLAQGRVVAGGATGTTGAIGATGTTELEEPAPGDPQRPASVATAG